MTSMVHDLSGNRRTDEQQKQAEPQIQQGAPAPPSSQAVVASDYVMPYGHLEMGHAMGQVAYPNIDPYYGGIYAAYGGQPMMHPQLVGMQPPGLPLPTDAIEEPVYVNAKQYNAILRRRQSRAKAESQNRLIKGRKPYLHESRHLHALKRARGTGGRFLNSKSDENKDENSDSNDGDERDGVVRRHDGRLPTLLPSESASLANQRNNRGSDKRKQSSKEPTLSMSRPDVEK